MGRPESAELGAAQPVGRLPLAGLIKGHKATAFARLLKGDKATAWAWPPDRLLTWTSLACGQLGNERGTRLQPGLGSLTS